MQEKTNQISQNTRPGRLKSVWITRGKSFNIKIGQDNVSFDTKIGLAVDVDSQYSTSDEIYESANNTLNSLLNKEMKNYINPELIREELKVLKTGIYDIIKSDPDPNNIEISITDSGISVSENEPVELKSTNKKTTKQKRQKIIKGTTLEDNKIKKTNRTNK